MGVVLQNYGEAVRSFKKWLKCQRSSIIEFLELLT
jgi:hypothetical protein